MYLEFDNSLINDDTFLLHEMSNALWKRLLSNSNFMAPENVVPRFLCMLGSTHVITGKFLNLHDHTNSSFLYKPLHSIQLDFTTGISPFDENIYEH